MSVHNSVTANSGLQVNSCVRHLRATADLNKAMQNTVSLTVIVHCFDILMIINNKKAGAAGEYFKPAITSDYCYIIHELFFTICSGLIVKIYITPVFLKKNDWRSNFCSAYGLFGWTYLYCCTFCFKQ